MVIASSVAENRQIHKSRMVNYVVNLGPQKNYNKKFTSKGN